MSMIESHVYEMPMYLQLSGGGLPPKPPHPQPCVKVTHDLLHVRPQGVQESQHAACCLHMGGFISQGLGFMPVEASACQCPLFDRPVCPHCSLSAF